MKLNDYQELAEATSVVRKSIKDMDYETLKRNLSLAYAALGMNGESGEVAEEIKKMIRNDAGQLTPERKEKIKLELGDVLWYVTSMCTKLGFSLEDIALANIAKLSKKYEEKKTMDIA